ncbi:MAG: FtsX-like permease family protein [Dysgonamonadaceae bacterium]|jgi:lipoprotein-releasing system permease protein/zinc transport system substrate-binding protein|nr:FtsX-like permease family protein [Dysgonamonadaceae bacterium]
MNFPFYIAKRYLFSKKSHNAVNIISIVAICGVSVATMATVCSLSVLNGFRGLMEEMFSAFDPELRITSVEGKTFNPEALVGEIRALPDVELIAESLEDNVMVNYRGRQGLAILKGVSDDFISIADFASTLIDGDTVLKDGVNNFTLLGIGIARNIGVNTGSVYPMEINAPRRGAGVNLSNPLSSINREYVYIGGVFSVKQAVYDENYMLVPIRLARNLFDCEKEVSALEIKLKTGASLKEMQAKIQRISGNACYVKDRYRQQEDTYKMVNIEKWATFLILTFILLIAAFNIVGSLSMLIVDKQADVITLRSLGADNRMISGVFLFEGCMISTFGAVLGIVAGLLLCLGQQHFGWLRLGTGDHFSVAAYPVIVFPSDLLFILLTVLTVGFFAVLYPVRYLARKWLA